MVVAGCKQDVEIHKADYTLTEAVQKYLSNVDKIRGEVVVKGWQSL